VVLRRIRGLAACLRRLSTGDLAGLKPCATSVLISDPPTEKGQCLACFRADLGRQAGILGVLGGVHQRVIHACGSRVEDDPVVDERHESATLAPEFPRMRFLLVSGLGPSPSSVIYALDGTLLLPHVPQDLSNTYARLAGRPVDVWKFKVAGTDIPLLRYLSVDAPHLPTATMRSILESADVDYEWYNAQGVWQGDIAPPPGDFDVVGLSTTFIWDQYTLAKAVAWIADRYPAATVVLGGQYSNLKYQSILAAHPEVDYVMRGDAEIGLPRLLQALAGTAALADVPNLAWRAADGSVQAPPIEYIDIEAHPSPSFRGTHWAVPYESMRGCPFTCKFCSFPAASPKWRFKSAEKIGRDWATYADQNGATVIKAYDSTFTIPPTRFRQLLSHLPGVGVPWEAYSRANMLGTREVFEQLEAAHCQRLFVGFEAMNATALLNMDKKVTVEQNRRAVEAMRGSNVEIRGAFMVGYPGETPADFELTRRFLVEDYAGPFGVHFFTFWDEKKCTPNGPA
jgi:anaerobic magnesium-protoporphyrin IX monomethyl ester cyclase